jgi:hypothetical protein
MEPEMIIRETEIIEISQVDAEPMDNSDETLPLDADMKDFDSESTMTDYDDDDDF